MRLEVFAKFAWQVKGIAKDIGVHRAGGEGHHVPSFMAIIRPTFHLKKHCASPDGGPGGKRKGTTMWINPLGSIQISFFFHGNPSNSCGDISVWTRARWRSQMTYRPASTSSEPRFWKKIKTHKINGDVFRAQVTWIMFSFVLRDNSFSFASSSFFWGGGLHLPMTEFSERMWKARPGGLCVRLQIRHPDSFSCGRLSPSSMPAYLTNW